ncbi:hypothetical protein HK100_003703 [Physocladia obscura]|uniref:DUF676 domain-containing protein n=1 Tax=Physocladia obscura TaxID=109957 RepID=A0AAD5SU24_9FUNG|nr:hypothetical protein HK100_003703 [Physocladia obscura]
MSVKRSADELALAAHPVAWDPKRFSELRVEGLEYSPAKHPVVLLHGLFGYDKISLGPESNPFLQLHYWRGISDALREFGCEVYVPSNGAVSSIRSRAHTLDKYLSENLSGREINLIAHSLGGLDARYLISHIASKGECNYSVISLTTIATPHRGSSFMDFVQEILGLGYVLDVEDPVVEVLKEQRQNIFGNENFSFEDHRLKSKYNMLKTLCSRFDKPAYANLTREYCNAFNKVTKDVSTVHYASYAAVAKISRLDPLYVSQSVISKREGPNDGLVSLESAKWGDFEGIVPNVDHWGLLPPRTLRRRKFSIADERENKKNAKTGGYASLDFYLSVVDRLKKKGF